MILMVKIEIPKEIKNIIQKLHKSGYGAYVVGGCVRDILRGADPEDWDITTDAKPEEIQKIFPDSFCENKFLTVTVQTGSKKVSLKEVEITTFRKEAKYTDKRHPDNIGFAKNLEEDLARRDFTVNAIALGLEARSLKLKAPTKKDSDFKLQDLGFKVVDLFNGQEDLQQKLIRAVGNPRERFSEDALRMMRAVRFATTMGWNIENETAKAIKENSDLIRYISQERIRDEFSKIIMSESAMGGIELLRELSLLKHILPELEEGYNIGQNKHHIYSCYEHNMRALDFAAKKNFNKNVRIASLLHDIAKPRVKHGEGSDSTFYGHEIVGAKMARQILDRLRFSNKDIDK
ncbi:MAG: polynucleotide adenylyltransferase/metal dependent phosphohydrolase, poly(A) polymerase, partial [Parcubacteria group bacterium GW2011_GWC1_38_6]